MTRPHTTQRQWPFARASQMASTRMSRIASHSFSAGITVIFCYSQKLFKPNFFDPFSIVFNMISSRRGSINCLTLFEINYLQYFIVKFNEKRSQLRNSRKFEFLTVVGLIFIDIFQNRSLRRQTVLRTWHNFHSRYGSL